MSDNRDHLGPLRDLTDVASGRRFRPRHPRLLHFLVAVGVASPRGLLAALLGTLGLPEVASVVLECVVYFVIGMAVGALWCESLEDAVAGWAGYALGQFVGLMLFGAWNWFLVYALVSEVMAVVPGMGGLAGGAGRRLLVRTTGKPQAQHTR